MLIPVLVLSGMIVSAGGRLSLTPTLPSASAICTVRPTTTRPTVACRDSLTPGSPVDASAMTAEAYVEEVEVAARLIDTVNWGARYVVHDQIVERTDPLWRMIDSLVRRHVADLQRRPLEPRYYLPLVHLEAQLGNDSAAQRYLAAWLATPKRTTQDSIVAIRLAVGSLLQREVTSARLALGRGYEARLQKFPKGAARLDLFRVRVAMMNAFDSRGQSDSAVAWGLRAYALLPAMPYEQRATTAADWRVLMPLIRALAGLPHGAARVDSLLTAIRSMVIAPPALVAQDTLYGRLQRMIQPEMEDVLGKAAQFGKPMPPFVATHWLNHARPETVSDAAPGARVLRLDDGIIRIVGFGWFGCGGCHLALRNAQKSLASLPPGVEVIFNERAEGKFNNDFCTPDEEAEDLRKWYVERKHFTFPIAIWSPVRDSTPGGGLVPRTSPLWAALNITTGPTIYIVDGHGIIRYMDYAMPRYSPYTTDDPMRVALEALVRERDAKKL